MLRSVDQQRCLRAECLDPRTDDGECEHSPWMRGVELRWVVAGRPVSVSSSLLGTCQGCDRFCWPLLAAGHSSRTPALPIQRLACHLAHRPRSATWRRLHRLFPLPRGMLSIVCIRCSGRAQTKPPAMRCEHIVASRCVGGYLRGGGISRGAHWYVAEFGCSVGRGRPRLKPAIVFTFTIDQLCAIMSNWGRVRNSSSVSSCRACGRFPEAAHVPTSGRG